LDEEDNIKITDFGLANFITPQKFTTFCGSLLYAAPEILHGHEYVGPAVDVYSLGVILYCLVNGRQPFDASSPYEMLKRINQGLHFDVEVTKELKDLINKMLAIDPKKRITLSEIRVHPWILKLHRNPPETYVPVFKQITQIDESIMREVVALGFDDNQKNRHDILKNKKYHQIVTAYQLCLNRRENLLHQLNETLEGNNSPKSMPTTPVLSKLKNASSNNRIIDGEQKRNKQPSSLKEVPAEREPVSEGPSTVIPTIVPHHPPLKRSFSNEEIASETTVIQTRRYLLDSQKKKSLGERDFVKAVAEGKQEANNVMDEFEEKLDEIMNDIMKAGNEGNKPIVFNRRTKRNTISGTSQTPGEKIDFDSPLIPPKSGAIPRINRPTAVSIDISSSTEQNSPSIRAVSLDNSEQRNLKLSSSFKCDTTSSKSTKEIKKQIISAAQKCSLQYERVSRYEYKISKAVDDADKVLINVEIVKMKGFKNLKGLTFKRVEGDIWQYKNVMSSFMNSINL
jgi:serine/threonine protein kinase